MSDETPDCKTVTVTVLGAGITGLSIAHELADRGFRVQVIEKAEPSPHRNPQSRPESMGPEPDIGGIARTQWAVDPSGRLSSSQFCWTAQGDMPDPFFGAGCAIRLLDPRAVTAEILCCYASEAQALSDGSWLDPLDRLPQAEPGGVFWLQVPSGEEKLARSVAARLVDRGYVQVHEDARVESSPPGLAIVRLMGIGPIDDAHFVPTVILSPALLRQWLDGLDDGPAASKAAPADDKAKWDGRDGVAKMRPTAGGSGRWQEALRTALDAEGARVYFGLEKWLLFDAESADLALALDGVNMPTVAVVLTDITVSFDFDGQPLRLIPGEHGWRFFPGFYRHLFNTMARTPLTNELHGVFTERTMLDNLEPVDWQVIADPTRRRPAAFRRTVESNPLVLRKQYYAMRRQLGYRPSDVMRFGLRMLRYMTSSSARRRRYYEDLSWFDFLTVRDLAAGKDSVTLAAMAQMNPGSVGRLSYGRRFERAIHHSPRALVAMNAATTDTRTQGNISVQLAMSQLGLLPRDDSTLPGPTSRAWFDHWRGYLEAQGVTFFQGEVKKVAFDETTQRVGVDVDWPAGQVPDAFVPPDVTDTSGDHYVVSALDLVALTEVLPDGFADFTRIRDMLPMPPSGTLPVGSTRADYARRIEARLAHENLQVLTGIQFYFRQRLNFAEGHIYFPDSPWGLSAVSQPQYWRSNLKSWLAPTQKEGGSQSILGEPAKAYGALSVDIGNWAEITAPSNPEHGPGARTAAELTAAETDPAAAHADTIAKETWRQIIRGYGEAARMPGAIPPPAAYHIDRYILLGPDGKPTRFDAPFVVNNIGQWKHRPHGTAVAPGAPGTEARVPGDGAHHALLDDAGEPLGSLTYWEHRLGGYRVYHDGFLMAGPHMRTFTRMNTMEACNESARHAVNGILDHLSRGKLPSGAAAPSPEAYGPDFMPTPYGDYCRIWDPEAYEIPELELMRRIDEKLLPPEDGEWDADDRPVGAPDPIRAPHVLDLLGIDTLPDFVETDDDAEAVFRMLEGVIDEVQRAQPEEARAAFAMWPGGPEADFASSAAFQGANVFVTRLVKLTRELLQTLSRRGEA